MYHPDQQDLQNFNFVHHRRRDMPASGHRYGTRTRCHCHSGTLHTTHTSGRVTSKLTFHFFQTSMEGPPPSFTPPYPSSRSNSTIPGTSTSAPSSGFLTIPHPTYNPSPSSDLFPKVSAVAQAHAEANADASGGQDDDDDDELA